LGNLGADDAMVVHGEDGLDEITISTSTKVSRFVNGRVENSYLAPIDFGLETGGIEDLVGGDKDENARITLSVLQGERGHKRNVVLMNSAAALSVSGKVSSLPEAFEMVRDAIDSGNASKKLKEIKKVSHSL